MQRFNLFILSVIFTPFILISCSKDEVQAEKSIEGTWNVVEIISNYGDFSNNGFNPTETVSDVGELGTFTFTDNSVDFNFTRNDTTYNGISSWNLDYEKVNSGFFKVPKFTLDISDQFLFDVIFEDNTKNAEKNATTVTFIENPTNDGFGIQIQLSLEKK